MSFVEKKTSNRKELVSVRGSDKLCCVVGIVVAFLSKVNQCFTSSNRLETEYILLFCYNISGQSAKSALTD